ncbi:hypothetical protein G3T36_18305 [Diaminobutyricibacter tongyongensis]|uniref:DUF2975 domain-containing protein n=1 Tax=Leifsonia tongyongensis TaxID=1268043 RepID=A0A6L9Y296_9MICO|nr:hypothetical protein [Diaminobutyricibacter tongyongensis]NEN07812.1 hypothetical protein [Diaminobutyricibacter tongyongensis]
MNTQRRTSLGRIILYVLSLGTLVYALGIVVFGVVALATQLAAGTIRPTMYWSEGQMQFTDTGDGTSGILIAGQGGAVVSSITGVSSSTVALYVTATLVTLLAQLALGVLALLLLKRLRSDRPFADSTWRIVAGSSVAVLTFGIVGQLLAWWTRVAVISESGGSNFSTSFVFEPLTVAITLSLALVAVAFRAAERLQYDSDGLV